MSTNDDQMMYIFPGQGSQYRGMGSDVCNELSLSVGVICPRPKTSKALKPHATVTKRIRSGPLSASQFPAVLSGKTGAFHKPA